MRAAFSELRGTIVVLLLAVLFLSGACLNAAILKFSLPLSIRLGDAHARVCMRVKEHLLQRWSELLQSVFFCRTKLRPECMARKPVTHSLLFPVPAMSGGCSIGDGTCGSPWRTCPAAGACQERQPIAGGIPGARMRTCADPHVLSRSSIVGMQM